MLLCRIVGKHYKVNVDTYLRDVPLNRSMYSYFD